MLASPYLKNLIRFLAVVTLLSRTRGRFTSQKLGNEENLKIHIFTLNNVKIGTLLQIYCRGSILLSG